MTRSKTALMKPEQLDTFRDVIDAHGGATELARHLGITPATIWKWYERDTLPAEWWLDVTERGQVTLQRLAQIWQRKKRGADRV